MRTGRRSRAVHPRAGNQSQRRSNGGTYLLLSPAWRTERSAYIRPQAVSELLVRDELEQAAVRVAEVHAGALAPGAAARHRPKLDLDAMRFEVFCSPGDRPGPHEAKVTTAGRHRNPRERLRVAASGAVHIQLLAAEAIHRDTVLVTDQLGGQYIPVEGVRASAIGDVDNPVVEVELDETER